MKLRTIAVSAALGLALLAGCGNESGTEESKAGEEKVAGQESKETDAGGDYTPADFASRMTDAMVDKSMHVTMESGAGANSISVEGDQVSGRTSAESAMQFQYELGADSFEVRFVDGLVYVNYGAKTQDKFIKADPSDPKDAFGRNFAPMINSLDLATSVENFSDAITKVEKAGDAEELDGVQATPYDVTIETAKMKGPAMEGVPAGALPATITYKFFMGSDDVARRMSIDMMGQKIVMDFTKVGEPVKIEAPAKSDQIDQSVLGGLAPAA